MQTQAAAVLCFTGGHNFQIITAIWNIIAATIVIQEHNIKKLVVQNFLKNQGSISLVPKKNPNKQNPIPKQT